jgi:hypothetical protein
MSSVKTTKPKSTPTKTSSKKQTKEQETVTQVADNVDVAVENDVENANVNTKGGKNDASKRSFTVLQVIRDNKEEDFKGGKYNSRTPAGAARKAANTACKSLYGKEPLCTIDIHIKEITKHQPNVKNHQSKNYGYRAVRTKDTKDVPFAGTSGKVSIPFEFSMSLRSLKKDKSGTTETIDETETETETITTA